MNRIARNKLKMYRAVQQHCAATQPDWNGMPAFVAAVGDFTNKLTDLEQLAQEQSTRTLGITADKDKQRETTANAADALHGVLIAYAKATGNTVLREQMRFSSTQLHKGKAENCIQLINRIIEEADRHLASLGDYGVTQASIDDLVLQNMLLQESIGSPRIAVVDRSQVTKAIAAHVNEIDLLLRDSLDQLALALKVGHTKFYDRYRAARKIVDYGVKKKKTEDEEDEAPPLAED